MSEDLTQAATTRALDSGEGMLVIFDSSVYRLSAIKKAAYRYGDRCHFLIRTTSEGRIEADVRAKDKAADINQLALDFANEALDQDLREQILAETEGIRNLLIAHSFSRTSLIDAEWDSAQYDSDAMHILQQPATNRDCE